jgi:crossover junction endodeoxyribonuclease RusA
MTSDPCGGATLGGAGCNCPPPFASDPHSAEQAAPGTPATPEPQNRSEGVAFFVVGTPAPQGSKRHVGGGRMIESSAKVGPWRAAVAWTAAEQKTHFPGAVDVDLAFRLARPKSAGKRLYPDRKPDLDKLIRSTLDGLTESGVIEDDARVVRLMVSKLYARPGDPTGATIAISEAS